MEAFKKSEPVSNWMTKEVIFVRDHALVSQAIDILDNHTIFGIPVVDDQQHFLGLISKTVIMNFIANSDVFTLPVSEIMMKDCETIRPQASIDEASQLEGGCLPVVNENGLLVGIMTRTDIIRANASRLDRIKEHVDYAETLKLVLNSAYEGIVVVNGQGYIQEINEAYCRLINCSREAILGRRVVDVIENTRLHIIAKTGIEERGYVQRIAGFDLVVHRIPIVKNQEVVGAIGMLVFKNISEMQAIYQRLNLKKQRNAVGHQHIKKEQASILKKITGSSPLMLAAKERAVKAAACASNVMIRGNSGTGKEVFAKAIHEMSAFSKGKFVSVNCSAIPETLLESELFGYEEGAFTDAKRGGKLGKFELAQDGTIFLDEIGDMPVTLQAKILRVLQERTIERVGSTEEKQVNVRVITATHRNLEQLVKEGKFREDLYYRIHVIPLYLPDLKERQSDIELFLVAGIRKFSEHAGVPEKKLSDEALRLLTAYSWPGNVRELLNFCEAAVALTSGSVIEVADLPHSILSEQADDGESNQRHLSQIEQQEKETIAQALRQFEGNKAATAKKLAISRSTLYEKIKKYQLA